MKSGEQSKWSEVPGRLTGRTGREAFICLWRASLVVSALLAPPVQAVETNSLPAGPAPAIRHPPPSLQDIAAADERAGRKREAAALYETMARTNATARKVLSHRLVTIYAEAGETSKALNWACEVMGDNPAPQAYLAAVYGRLGQSREAQETLEGEIARNTNGTRAVTLRWQLAEVFEKAGDSAKARKALDEAARAARGTPVEPAARQRVNASKNLGR